MDSCGLRNELKNNEPLTWYFCNSGWRIYFEQLEYYWTFVINLSWRNTDFHYCRNTRTVMRHLLGSPFKFEHDMTSTPPAHRALRHICRAHKADAQKQPCKRAVILPTHCIQFNIQQDYCKLHKQWYPLFWQVRLSLTQNEIFFLMLASTFKSVHIAKHCSSQNRKMLCVL